MSSITLSHVAWSTLDHRAVFTNLDLSFGRERAGLVGRNGVGKSTLLKIIAGIVQPSAGTVTVNGTFGHLKQTVQVAPHETIADLFGVRDAIALLQRAEAGTASIDELADADWTIGDRVVAALARVGLDADLHTNLTALSGGQRTRASLAAAIFDEPDFLLLDEPTNNLDSKGRTAVSELLGDWRKGAIIISHDRALLEHMDVIVEMTSLGAQRYGGNWSAYRARKNIELEAAQHDLAHAEKTVAEVDRKAQIAAERKDRRDAAGARKAARGDLPRILLGGRKSSAEASRGAGMRLAGRQRADAREAAADARARVEILQHLSFTLPSSGLASGRQVLSLEGVTAGYDAAHPLIRNMSLSMTGPERVTIAGPNGSGKTTLLKVITGEMKPLTGSATMHVNFAILDQKASILDPGTSIVDNFKRFNPGTSDNSCRAALANFLFRADAALQLVGTLSGGQMLRAALACVLGGPKPPALLILDEPTNHLDVDSVEAIESCLSAFDGALLVVSHDVTFLANIGINRRLELTGG